MFEIAKAVPKNPFSSGFDDSKVSLCVNVPLQPLAGGAYTNTAPAVAEFDVTFDSGALTAMIPLLFMTTRSPK